MKNIRGVMKKDLDKIFRFPSAIFSTIILPGLILFLMYAVMGTSLQSIVGEDEEYYSKIILVNMPESFNPYIESKDVDKIDYTLYVDSNFDLELTINAIKEENYDLLVIFDKDFDNGIEMESQPKITLYGNELNNESSSALLKMNTIMSDYKNQILLDKGINQNVLINNFISVTDTQEKNAFGIAMLIPMLIITFVFAGALGVGADAVAGEKERGTLSTLLMAPIKRNEIILGKIASTTVLSLLSAISSFVGIIASLPFAKQMFGLEGAVVYPFGSYIQLFIIILILAMFASSTILICSTFAKSVKEATNFAMPLYIVAILIAVLSMFSSMPSKIGLYMIPIYNLALGIKGLLSFDLLNIQFAVIVISNIVYIAIIVFLLVKMFRNEKFMFSK